MGKIKVKTKGKPNRKSTTQCKNTIKRDKKLSEQFGTIKLCVFIEMLIRVNDNMQSNTVK